MVLFWGEGSIVSRLARLVTLEDYERYNSRLDVCRGSFRSSPCQDISPTAGGDPLDPIRTQCRPILLFFVWVSSSYIRGASVICQFFFFSRGWSRDKRAGISQFLQTKKSERINLAVGGGLGAREANARPILPLAYMACFFSISIVVLLVLSTQHGCESCPRSN